MEPLSPNDPLLNLLGKARPVEPRSNFTQNVLRAVRQAPQSLGLGERLSAWFGELAMPRVVLAGAAVVAAGVVAVAVLQKPVAKARVVAQQAPLPVVQPAMAPPAIYQVSATMILAATAEAAVAPAVDEMDPMGLLLVRQDTSALTDSELALLVY